jgi:hypothetical protein
MTRTEQQQWQKDREGIMERLMESCRGVHQLGRDYCIGGDETVILIAFPVNWIRPLLL